MPILTTVLVTQRITLLYGARGSETGPLQIVNLDPNNTLYLATTSNPNPNQPGTFPLSPLASLAFDGSTAIYGVVSTATPVIAGIVPGGQGYSPGELAISGPVTATISGPVSAVVSGTVAVSSVGGSVNVSGSTVGVSGGTIDVSGSSVDITTGNVNATGVGGFILPGNVNNLFASSGSVALAPGATSTPLSLVDVSNYNSYDFAISVSDTSQATLNHAHAYRIIISWFDDLVSGIPVFQEVWCPWVSSSVNSMVATGTGPMHGKYMTVVIAAYSGATGNINIDFCRIFGSGRATPLSEWRQQVGNTKSDQAAHVIVNVGIDRDNMLADTNGMINVTANLTYVVFLGLYSGPMDWSLQIGAGGGLTRSNIINVGSNGSGQTSGNLNPQVNSLEVLGTASGNSAGSQLLPRSACAFIFTVAAANTTVEFTAVAQQGP